MALNPIIPGGYDGRTRTFARFPAGTNPLAALHEAMRANVEDAPGFGSLAKALEHERFMAGVTWWLVWPGFIPDDPVGPFYCLSSKDAATVLAATMDNPRVSQVAPFGNCRLGDSNDPEAGIWMVEAERVRIVADVTPTPAVLDQVRAELGSSTERDTRVR
jgi:hypothetical protein